MSDKFTMPHSLNLSDKEHRQWATQRIANLEDELAKSIRNRKLEREAAQQEIVSLRHELAELRRKQRQQELSQSPQGVEQGGDDER